MKTKVFFLSVFLMCLLTINLLAQKERMEYKKHRAEMGCVFLDDLTDAQKEKIQAIKIEKHQKNSEMRADLKIKKAELNKMRLSSETPESEINSKVDEIAGIRAEIQKERLACERTILNELTPEQQAKYRMHKGSKRGMHGHKGFKDTYRPMKNKKMRMHPNCPYGGR